MKDRPILFSAPMVRAILDGKKTQTRRICKGQRELSNIHDFQLDRCPYGQPGDRLWVRESWCGADDPAHKQCVHYRADGERSTRWRPSIFMPRWASRITLEITGVRVERLQDISYDDALAEGVFDNYALLNDDWIPLDGETGNETARRLKWPQRLYCTLWESINGPGSWAANPWVWCISFQKIVE